MKDMRFYFLFLLACILDLFKYKIVSTIPLLETFDFSRLKNLLDTFRQYDTDCTSQHVVAVYPLPTPPAIRIDRWGIDFKSTRMSDKVKGLARFAEDRLFQELFDLFHKIPETSSMAGWIFELIAHRLLSGGWQRWDVSILPPIPMGSLESDEDSSPLFSTDSPIGTSPVRVGQRTIIRPKVTKYRELSEVTLEGNRCCIPTASTNPLFDSFTVDFDRNLHTVVISIFQITSQTQT